jgi:mannose-6-phosphate isomerase-like protein (cupin superfamily)
MTERVRVVRAGEGRTGGVPGEKFTGKLSGDDTGDRVAMGENLFSPRHGTTAHRHVKSGELFYIAMGSITVEIGDEEFALDAGDLAYAPPGATHRLTNVSDAPVRVIAMFLPAGPEKGLRALVETMARTGGKPTPEEREAALAKGDTIEVGPARMTVDA